MGVLVLNSWQFQNPEINGYKSISAYLPSRRISLAITSTEGPIAAKAGNNLSAQLFNDIALYLTPGHPAVPVG